MTSHAYQMFILMFIYMQKINLILLFFLEILRFKESYNPIGREHFGA